MDKYGIFLFSCLLEVDLEEHEICLDAIFHPLQKILGYFLTYALIPLVAKCNFCVST